MAKYIFTMVVESDTEAAATSMFGTMVDLAVGRDVAVGWIQGHGPQPKLKSGHVQRVDGSEQRPSLAVVAKAVLAVLLLLVVLTPAKAQDSHSLNSNSHAPTMNNGMSSAFHAAPVAGSASGPAADHGATNDGAYVPSDFLSYQDALKLGQQQVQAVTATKTLAQLAKEAQEKKAADQAAKKPTLQLHYVDGKLVATPAPKEGK